MIAVQQRSPDPVSDTETGIVLRAAARAFDLWGLAVDDAASLAGVKPRTWTRMRGGSWSGTLNQDQTMRLSGLIGLYKALHLYFGDDLADQWITRANTGPLFRGQRPVEFMREGGLPAILETRNYVDALRGGL